MQINKVIQNFEKLHNTVMNTEMNYTLILTLGIWNFKIYFLHNCSNTLHCSTLLSGVGYPHGSCW